MNLEKNSPCDKIESSDIKKIFEQKEVYQKYFDIVGVLIFSLDVNGNIQMVNKMGCKILGYTSEELIGMNWFEKCLPERLKKEVSAIFSKLMAGEIESAEYYENPIVTKQGEERILYWHNSILKDESEKIIGVLSSAEDITHQKKQYDDLKKSEDNYHRLINNIGGNYFVYRHDLNGIFTFLSDSVTSVLGYPTNDFTAHYTKYLTKNPINELVIKHTEQSMKGIKQPNYQVEIFHANGSKHWLDVSESPIFNDFGKVIAIEGIAQDITDKKYAEEELNKKEYHLNSMINTSPAAILSLDKEGNVTLWNPAAEKIFGWKEEEVLGKQYLLVPDSEEEKFNIEFEQMLLGKTFSNLEAIRRGKDGSLKTVLVSSAPIFDSSGNITGTMAILEDITRRKEMESSLSKNNTIFVAINNILHTSLEEMAMDDFLKKALDIIISMDWLALQNKGSIFLSDGNDTLIMKVQKNLHPVLLEKCAKVNFGYCLCGLAASTKEIVFKNKLDDDHKTSYEGIIAHGHYCIPIILKGKTIGVINVYVKENHVSTDLEKYFFIAVADALAGIIERKKIEFALKSEKDELESFNNIMIDREIKMIALKKEINDLLKKSGDKEKYDIV